MRKDWDQYFMDIAKQAATRATCDRKHVGAVIVRDKVILSLGYNGAPKSLEHCSDVGHLMENGHCVRSLHAEMNTIIQAAKNGINIDGSDIYTNTFPCWLCFKMLVNTGIRRIVYDDTYRVDKKVVEAATKLGIELVDINDNR